MTRCLGWWGRRNVLTPNTELCLRGLGLVPDSRGRVFQPPHSRFWKITLSRQLMMAPVLSLRPCEKMTTSNAMMWVNWVFGFHQYEYESVLRLTTKHSEIFVLMHTAWMPTVQYAVSKFMDEWFPSLCCLPLKQFPTVPSLLPYWQNAKQMKHMSETEDLQWCHHTVYIIIINILFHVQGFPRLFRSIRLCLCLCLYRVVIDRF